VRRTIRPSAHSAIYSNITAGMLLARTGSCVGARPCTLRANRHEGARGGGCLPLAPSRARPSRTARWSSPPSTTRRWAGRSRTCRRRDPLTFAAPRPVASRSTLRSRARPLLGSRSCSPRTRFRMRSCDTRTSPWSWCRASPCPAASRRKPRTGTGHDSQVVAGLDHLLVSDLRCPDSSFLLSCLEAHASLLVGFAPGRDSCPFRAWISVSLVASAAERGASSLGRRPQTDVLSAAASSVRKDAALSCPPDRPHGHLRALGGWTRVCGSPGYRPCASYALGTSSQAREVFGRAGFCARPCRVFWGKWGAAARALGGGLGSSAMGPNKYSLGLPKSY
jgi:hypothetical protein